MSCTGMSCTGMSCTGMSCTGMSCTGIHIRSSVFSGLWALPVSVSGPVYGIFLDYELYRCYYQVQCVFWIFSCTGRYPVSVSGPVCFLDYELYQSPCQVQCVF
jgi:uncharacterized membrane protein